MKRTHSLLCGIAVVGLAGCSTMHVSQAPNVPVTKVLDQLKYELAVFAQATDGREFAFEGGKRCGGNGKLKMAVTSIEVTLSTEIARAESVGGSFTAPVSLGPITLGPTASLGRTVGNSQVVTLNLMPVDLTSETLAKNESDLLDLPLATALIALRDQLRAVKDAGKCIKFASDNKLSLAFTAENSSDGGVKFNLVVLAVDATDKQTIKAGNTLTVSLNFEGTGPFLRSPTR